MVLAHRFLVIGSLCVLAGICGCAASTEGGASGTGGSGSGGAGSGGAGPGSGGNVGPSGSGGTSGSGGSGGTIAPGGSGGSSVDAAKDVVPVADSGGGGDAGKPAPRPSMGCGMPAGQALSTYVQQNVTSGGVARTYRLYLPGNYDVARPYPLIILGHGCTGNGGTPFPIETASKTGAIVVALKSVGSCFEYSPTGPDVTYFDDVLAQVSAGHCVDTGRVFVAGFSSGSWLSHTLGCVRADKLRGQGNASGNQVTLNACKGPIAAMFAHDVNDDQNSFAGAIKARDRILKSNGCTDQTIPYDYDGDPATPSTCVIYQGCMPGYPVVWCPTMAPAGRPTHNNQVPISTVGFWRFWSQF
jgi:polyhydroxybutyrate depolymerase